MPPLAKTWRKPRAQYAALPYRRDKAGALEVFLVTSRETKRWVIPKGWPIRGLKPHDSAAREAYEEAGLEGDARKRSIGRYMYDKRVDQGHVACEVDVFPLAVKRQRKRWPEKGQREGRWFDLSEAAEAVQEPELAALIRDLPARLASKGREAQAADDV